MTPPAEFVIATGNPGKVREFRDILGGPEWAGSDRPAWLGLADLPPVAEVPETGDTFRANACLKAAGYALATGRWAMADDSGLCVDALDGGPGIYSARWAGMHGAGTGDAANNALLLSQLQAVPDDRRSARFTCVLAVADPDGRIVLTVADDMAGRLLRVPRGTNGFGYDPLFVPAGLDATSAELSVDQKHRISHRGKALRRLRQLLVEQGLVGR
jgi:non-canonical purine NTP pyrophosphatase (RdgB/HAM1 family)